MVLPRPPTKIAHLAAWGLGTLGVCGLASASILPGYVYETSLRLGIREAISNAGVEPLGGIPSLLRSTLPLDYPGNLPGPAEEASCKKEEGAVIVLVSPLWGGAQHASNACAASMPRTSPQDMADPSSCTPTLTVTGAGMDHAALPGGPRNGPAGVADASIAAGASPAALLAAFEALGRGWLHRRTRAWAGSPSSDSSHAPLTHRTVAWGYGWLEALRRAGASGRSVEQRLGRLAELLAGEGERATRGRPGLVPTASPTPGAMPGTPHGMTPVDASAIHDRDGVGAEEGSMGVADHVVGAGDRSWKHAGGSSHGSLLPGAGGVTVSPRPVLILSGLDLPLAPVAVRPRHAPFLPGTASAGQQRPPALYRPIADPPASAVHVPEPHPPGTFPGGSASPQGNAPPRAVHPLVDGAVGTPGQSLQGGQRYVTGDASALAVGEHAPPGVAFVRRVCQQGWDVVVTGGWSAGCPDEAARLLESYGGGGGSRDSGSSGGGTSATRDASSTRGRDQWAVRQQQPPPRGVGQHVRQEASKPAQGSRVEGRYGRWDPGGGEGEASTHVGKRGGMGGVYADNRIPPGMDDRASLGCGAPGTAGPCRMQQPQPDGLCPGEGSKSHETGGLAEAGAWSTGGSAVDRHCMLHGDGRGDGSGTCHPHGSVLPIPSTRRAPIRLYYVWPGLDALGSSSTARNGGGLVGAPEVSTGAARGAGLFPGDGSKGNHPSSTSRWSGTRELWRAVDAFQVGAGTTSDLGASGAMRAGHDRAPSYPSLLQRELVQGGGELQDGLAALLWALQPFSALCQLPGAGGSVKVVPGGGEGVPPLVVWEEGKGSSTPVQGELLGEVLMVVKAEDEMLEHETGAKGVGQPGGGGAGVDARDLTGTGGSVASEAVTTQHGAQRAQSPPQGERSKLAGSPRPVDGSSIGGGDAASLTCSSVGSGDVPFPPWCGSHGRTAWEPVSLWRALALLTTPSSELVGDLATMTQQLLGGDGGGSNDDVLHDTSHAPSPSAAGAAADAGRPLSSSTMGSPATSPAARMTSAVTTLPAASALLSSHTLPYVALRDRAFPSSPGSLDELLARGLLRYEVTRVAAAEEVARGAADDAVITDSRALGSTSGGWCDTSRHSGGSSSIGSNNSARGSSDVGQDKTASEVAASEVAASVQLGHGCHGGADDDGARWTSDHERRLGLPLGLPHGIRHAFHLVRTLPEFVPMARLLDVGVALQEWEEDQAAWEGQRAELVQDVERFLVTEQGVLARVRQLDDDEVRVVVLLRLDALRREMKTREDVLWRKRQALADAKARLDFQMGKMLSMSDKL